MRSDRFVCLLAGLVLVVAAGTGCAQPRNVIIFIGDGMGPEQVLAGRVYAGHALSFETMDYHGKVTTYSADSAITDSAAAGTAIATGTKVNNGVISLRTPGDGQPLETILERLKAAGKATGLVTTAYVTHATPAAFGAHNESRSNYEAIGLDYLENSRPNLILGGGLYMQDLTATVADHGYTVVRTLAEFDAVSTDTVPMLSGQFGLTADGVPYESNVAAFDNLPHLSEMTAKALQILDNEEDGFFLMVEGGKIDWACHAGNLTDTVLETVEFSRAVKEALTWAQERNDTLILVTADHETGGLTVTRDNGAGAMPTVTWSTGDHTATNVDIYAQGPNAQHVYGAIDNTDIFGIITAHPARAFDPWPAADAAFAGLDVLLSWAAGPGAATYDVYLGTDPDAVANATPESPECVGNQSTTVLDPGQLEPGTTYYWCVDVRDANTDVVAPGRVWQFTTMGDLPVAPGAYWQYDDTATDLGTAWTGVEYDDGAWPGGAAQLGYGDGDEATLLRPGLTVDRTPCYYLRHAFWVDNPGAWTELELQLVRDDGAVVYLNGVEVARSNMPGGEIAFSTLASSVVGSTDESAWFAFPVEAGLLRAGKNVISVEMHQGDPQSSDISFDLALAPPVDDVPGVPANLGATAGDGWVALDWDDLQEPEGDLDGYQVYRGVAPAPLDPWAWATESAFLDTGLENGVTYYYAVAAVDLAGQEGAPSAEVFATPEAPSVDAYVLADPVVILGTVAGGSYTGLAVAGDGLTQTLAEGPDGKAGASSLLAEYQLYTPADPASITSLELAAVFTWDDTDDALIVEAWQWSTGTWDEITGAVMAGDWSPATPGDYIDPSGLLTIRFSDTAPVRKENKGNLVLDQLYGAVQTGDPVQDTTPPEILEFSVTPVTHNAATVNVTTNEMTTVVVNYGLEALDLAAESPALSVSHSIELTGLTPEQGYAVQVDCTDASGNKATSTVISFTTETEPSEETLYVGSLGMELVSDGRKASGTVTATVYSGDTAVAGATVTGDWLFRGAPLLSGAVAVTDVSGVAVFESPQRNVKPGDVFQFNVTGVTLPGYRFDANAGTTDCYAVVP